MTDFPLHKKLVFTAVIFLVFLFLLTLVGEIGVRIFTGNKYQKTSLVPPYDSFVADEKLGWKPKPQYTFNGKMTDFKNVDYDVSLYFNKNGFKAFGNVNSLKVKVLFIGDSYTSSIEVSNEKSYFSLLQDSLDLEVFALGQAGFGSLQEYMLLDKWVDLIRPDLVVWQFCCNDFIDNYAPLEIECGYKIGRRRPYLGQDGKVFYRRPLSFWQKTKELVFFYRWLEDHWHPFKKKVFGLDRRQGEDHMESLKEQYLPFQESIAITQRILHNIKKRLPQKTGFIAFAADYRALQIEVAAKIFQTEGIPFTDEPARMIEDIQSSVNCKSEDGYHWNETGHRVVANSILPIVQNYVEVKAKQ